MNELRLFTIWFFIIISFCVLNIGAIIGIYLGRRSIYIEAIDHGVGRYISDEYGKIEFEWGSK